VQNSTGAVLVSEAIKGKKIAERLMLSSNSGTTSEKSYQNVTDLRHSSQRGCAGSVVRCRDGREE
jgi:hypothetical protein